MNAVLEGLEEIWPGGSSISGRDLGDVWPARLLNTDSLGNEYIPLHKLHKLSQ
ncbi:MAG: DUF1688 family protein [Microcoleaceae cyanobacterium]